MNTMKKLLCFSLVFCMIFSFVSFARAEIPVPTTPQSTTTQSSTTQSGTTQATPPINPEPDTSNYPKTFYDIDYSTPLGIALEALTERDIITGFPDGTFKSTQSLTRAEFSKIIVCFSAGGTAVNSTSGFPDVDNVGSSAHWAQPYIKTAKDMGIISGFPDGTFKPDSPVTYEQAVKMIMCALNYKDYTYPDGFMQIALQKKLFVNSTHQGLNSDNINRGTVSILVYNAFSISPKTEISIGGDLGGGSFGGGGGGSSSGGGGGSSSSFTRKIFGIVWGNTNTDLDYSSNSLLDNELKIRYDEKTTDPETGEEITVTKTEVFPVADKYAKNLNAFLGRNVRIDLSEDDRGNEYISYLLALDSNNSSTYVDFSSRKSLSLDSVTGSYIFEYYDSNDNVKKLTLENDEPVYIIYNGKSIRYNADSEYEFDPTCISDPKLGNAEFLSNDGDKKSNVLFVTSYETAVVSSRSTSSNGDYILKFKHNIPELNVGPLEGNSSFRSITITSKTGLKLKPSSIVKGDVIDYASSKDGSTLNIIVNQSSLNSISGSVSKEIANNKISIKKSDSKTGTVYELNYSYIDYLNDEADDDEDKYIPVRNDNVKVRLNSFGKIADIEKVTTSITEKYGYIVSAGFQTDSGWIEADDLLDNPDAKIMLKLHEMDKNGNSKTGINSSLVPIASTVTIDGIIYKNPAAVEERLKKAALLANTGKSLLRADYASFIRFSTTNGAISYIDTILDGRTTSLATLSTESDEDYNTLVRSSFVYNSIGDELEGKHKFYYGNSSTSGFYKTSSSDRVRCNSYTKYLFVPSSMSKESSFKSGKYDYKNFNNNMTYYIEAYNVTSTQNNAEFLIQYITEGTEDVSAYSNVAIVKSVNDPTPSEQGSIVSYLMPGSTSISGSTSSSTVSVSEGSPAEEKMSDLSAGDVILYSVLNGQIYDYYLALDVDNLPVKRIDSYDKIYSTASINDRRIKGFDVYPDDTVQNTEKNARFRTIYGTVVEYDSTAKILYVNPALSTDYIESPSDAYTEEFLISTSEEVYVYTETSSDPKLEYFTSSNFFSDSYEGDFTTAEDLDGSYGGASHVFIYTYGGTTSDPALKFIYVINAPSQQSSPSNYEDSSSSDSVLENAKISAIEEIESYKTDESYTYVTYSSALTSARNAAISQIEEAETVIGVNNALVSGKNAIDNIPDDNAKQRAIEEISNYINTEEYPLIADEILGAISELEEAIISDEIDTNEEILALVNEGKSSLDNLLSLSEIKEDAKTELDDYLSLLEEESEADFTSDETLASLVELLKSAIDATSDEESINDALIEAKTQLDEYISTYYPDSSEEID